MNRIGTKEVEKHYNLKTGELNNFKENVEGVVNDFFIRMKESKKPCEDVKNLEREIVFLTTKNKELKKIIELAKIKITSGEKKLKTFEEKLKINPVKVLNRENSLRSLPVRWTNVLKRFEESYSKAFAFLNFCSFFNPKSIPKKWVFEWLRMEEVGEVKDVNLLLKILKEFGIVEYDSFSSTFSLHKYMQKIVQENMPNKREIFEKAFHFLVLKVKREDYYYISKWGEMNESCSHLKFMLKNEFFKTEWSKEFMKDLIKAYDAMEFLKMGNSENEKALKYCKRAYEIVKKLYGNEPHKEMFFHLHRIGKYYYDMNDYGLALKSLLEALKVSKEIYKEAANEDVCNCVNYIAHCYSDLERNEEGETYHTQALEMKKKLDLIKKNKSKIPKVVKKSNDFTGKSNGIIEKLYLREFENSFTKF